MMNVPPIVLAIPAAAHFVKLRPPAVEKVSARPLVNVNATLASLETVVVFVTPIIMDPLVSSALLSPATTTAHATLLMALANVPLDTRAQIAMLV